MGDTDGTSKCADGVSSFFYVALGGALCYASSEFAFNQYFCTNHYKCAEIIHIFVPFVHNLQL